MTVEKFKNKVIDYFNSNYNNVHFIETDTDSEVLVGQHENDEILYDLNVEILENKFFIWIDDTDRVYQHAIENLTNRVLLEELNKITN